MTYEYLPKSIDHINGIKDDNRIINLRECTTQQNGMNRGPQKNNSSGYKGVGWSKKSSKWRAQIRFNNKSIYLGLFDDKKEAAKIYNKEAKKLFGEFVYLNEVD